MRVSIAPARLLAAALALSTVAPALAQDISDPGDEWDLVDAADGEATYIRAASLSGPMGERQFEAEHRYSDGTSDRALLIANCAAKTLALKHLDEMEGGKVTNSFDATGDQATPRPAVGKASTEGMIAYVCAN